MTSRRIALLVPILALLPWAVFGCGGGGGGGATRANLGVYITDGFSDLYDHVWATIYHVEVIGDPGTRVVFDDPAGVVVDLKTLRDASGARFDLLALSSVPSGMYRQARVTIGNTIMLFPRGATTGLNTPVSGDSPRDGQGRPVATFGLQSPRDLGSGSANLVIDFDLDNFAIIHTASGDVVKIAVKEGAGEGIENRERHDEGRFTGVVSGLSGTPPNQSFTLVLGDNMSVVVTTGPATAIFRSDGAANPMLANGAHVQVRGTFDPSTHTLPAVSVKILVGNEGDRPEVSGVPSSINASAGTFVLTIGDSDGFVPPQTTVLIATNASTVFRAEGGVVLTAAEFFAQLSPTTRVEARGTYDPATNTLTASLLRLETEGDGEHHNVEARGTAVNVNATAGTFSISPVTEWDGFMPMGGSVDVATTASTRFRGLDDAEITGTAFFAALAPGSHVSVEGQLSANVITAAQARLRP